MQGGSVGRASTAGVPIDAWRDDRDRGLSRRLATHHGGKGAMNLLPAEESALAFLSASARDTTPPAAGGLVPVDEDILEKLERRLGRGHARQRIGIEDDHEAWVFGHGLNFFHPENWSRSPAIIRNALKLTGLYWRARKNAE